MKSANLIYKKALKKLTLNDVWNKFLRFFFFKKSF